MTKDQPDTSPRKMSRDTRRAQLIEATIQTLALRGYARTTLTEVARTAGLSHGLVNFHFESKEKLLSETLALLAEEYRQNWQTYLNRAGQDPAAQLAALLLADFDPAVFTQARLSAWCSFWGEAQSRPLYQVQCGANDAAYNARIAQVCGALLTQGAYLGDAQRVARVLRVTIQGVWLDMITTTPDYTIEEGQATVHACAAAFFPRHFSDAGLIL